MSNDGSSIQIGGTHYRSEYQHWDWVYDALGGDYLLGCCTKYVVRWRRKNGLQDLIKSKHYLQKHMAIGNLDLSTCRTIRMSHTERFIEVNRVTGLSADFLRGVVRGECADAKAVIDHLIVIARAEGYSEEGFCAVNEVGKPVHPGFVWEGCSGNRVEWRCLKTRRHVFSRVIDGRVSVPIYEDNAAEPTGAYVNQGAE
jgi:hypothetical protein